MEESCSREITRHKCFSFMADLLVGLLRHSEARSTMFLAKSYFTDFFHLWLCFCYGIGSFGLVT